MEEPSEISNFRKISVLGSGGFGIVVLWQCMTTHDFVAIKKCNRSNPSALSAKQKDRWENEVQIMRNLTNNNIVKFKCIPEDFENNLMKYNPSKLPLLSMEYCKKGNLRHILSQPKNLCGLEQFEIFNILLDISNAVFYLHRQKITHRDIKPDNIVLQECDGRKGNTIYKLIDLGYAKELNDSNVSFVGTLFYLAPEIFFSQSYNHSVDYWSFGILTFEVVCGVLPFPIQLPAIERFKLFKQKSPEDICMYSDDTGSIKYSSHFFNEIRLSHNLHKDLEIWLRHVLQINPIERGKNIENSENIFTYLTEILSKKIVTVFVVPNFEFYTYEFNHLTKLSSLQNWVTRDAEVQKVDQVVLAARYQNDGNDVFLKDCFDEDEYILYVFSKSNLFKNASRTIYKTIRKMFEQAKNKHKWKDLKLMYSHSILYILQNTDRSKALIEGLKLFSLYVEKTNAKFQSCAQNSNLKVQKLINKLNEFNKLKKNQSTDANNVQIINVKDIFLYYKRLIASIERTFERNCKLMEKAKKTDERIYQLKLLLPKAIDLVKLDDTEELLTNACALLQKECSIRYESNVCSKAMIQIVSSAIKVREKLLNGANLADYFLMQSNFIQYCNSLMAWIDEFCTHIDQLSKSLNNVETELLLKRQNTEYNTSSSNSETSLQQNANSQENLPLITNLFLDDPSPSFGNYSLLIDSFLDDIL